MIAVGAVHLLLLLLEGDFDLAQGIWDQRGFGAERRSWGGAGKKALPIVRRTHRTIEPYRFADHLTTFLWKCDDSSLESLSSQIS